MGPRGPKMEPRWGQNGGKGGGMRLAGYWQGLAGYWQGFGRVLAGGLTLPNPCQNGDKTAKKSKNNIDPTKKKEELNSVAPF